MGKARRRSRTPEDKDVRHTYYDLLLAMLEVCEHRKINFVQELSGLIRSWLQTKGVDDPCQPVDTTSRSKPGRRSAYK
jgi:hypothetical protein